MDSFKKQLLVQIVIGFVIFIALIGGLLFFGSNIKDYSAKIDVARQDLIARSVSLSSLATLRTQYNTKAKDYLTIINNLVPVRDQLINFSREAQGLASDVEGFGFSFLGESQATAESFGAISFTINLQATIPQLIKFLENVEKFRYLATVENLTLNRQPDSFYQIPVKGKVFFK